MDFATAWSSSSLNDYIAVSNGAAMPTKIGGFPWRCWRSHNFVGRLVAKVDGVVGERRMIFDLAPHERANISYVIDEAGDQHSFVLSDSNTFLSNVFSLF